MKLVAIGDRTFTTGFLIAGLYDVIVVSEVKEFEDALSKMFEDENIGIIIAQDEFLNKVNWRIKKEINRRAIPVVVPVNIKGKEIVGESIDALIKRALGFELKR